MAVELTRFNEFVARGMADASDSRRRREHRRERERRERMAPFIEERARPDRRVRSDVGYYATIGLVIATLAMIAWMVIR